MYVRGRRLLVALVGEYGVGRCRLGALIKRYGVGRCQLGALIKKSIEDHGAKIAIVRQFNSDCRLSVAPVEDHFVNL